MSVQSSSGSASNAVPSKNTSAHPACDNFASFGEAALHWFKFGFRVIPIVPSTKRTALRWDPWLEDLSNQTIVEHWARHPDHEVGFIVGDDLIVFDADTTQAVAALAEIERAFDVVPSLVVTTRKGQHHYLKRANGMYARSDAHSTEQYPERIDVKTGRALVILPPSTGKTIALDEASSARELVEVGQEFIDAVYRHNGRTAPRSSGMTIPECAGMKPSSERLRRLGTLLGHIDPDVGYDDWLRALMAVFHETSGSEEGFELANGWSRKGKKYKGIKDIRIKWLSFNTNQESACTMATLVHMLKAGGVDWVEACDAAEPQFEPCEHVVVEPREATPDVAAVPATPLDHYSLLGQTHEIEKHAVEAFPILGQLALKGQLTVFYAAPNTGKTLLTLSLIIEAIKRGSLQASRTYYLNIDDTSRGLLEKARIAEEYGFHMLSEGYREFNAGQFLPIVLEMMENDQAHGVMIVLDTLKKFVDLMDKGKSSGFTQIIRRFALKGGTLIALAHINKNLGRNGKPIYGGTTDILDDFDCAYVLAPIPAAGAGEKVVEFDNIKRRGNVEQTAAYRYACQSGMSYHALLLSVEAVDAIEVAPLKQAEQLRSDAEIIEAVITCIKLGINTKMRLADEIAVRSGISRRSALQVIEKHTGDDHAVHRWKFTVRERGAKVYTLLEHTPPTQAPPQP